MRGKRKLIHPDSTSGDPDRGAAIREIAHAGETPHSLSPDASDDVSAAAEPIELDPVDCTGSSTPGFLEPDPEHLGLFDDTLLEWSPVSAGALDEGYADDIFDILGDTPPELPQQQPQQQQQQQQHQHQQLPRVGQGGPGRMSHPSLSYPPNTVQLSGMETAYQSPRMHGSPFSSRHSTTMTPHQMTAADSDRNHERNHQCVIACSQIIFSLEKYQLDKLKVLNFILGIVKGVTRKLDPLVDNQFAGCDTKCLALFDIIIYQLAEILETGCADFLADTSDAAWPLSMELMDPGFHEVDIGGFGMGLKDRERFRSQIILEVLRPVTRIMQKVLFISSSAGIHGDNCAREGQDRLKSLEEKIKKRAEDCSAVAPGSRGKLGST
ncbi:hypothetical protein F4778DRAFT_732185 [Xylariomycetidae sp. FL2044]|nr:hypothetical protein F4778DRAFT_732185 [Xylariomycetidae sp. FL2044]